MKFKEVYSWEIISKLKHGATVIMIDKENQVIADINSIEVSTFIDILKTIEENADRFYFYSKTTEEGSES